MDRRRFLRTVAGLAGVSAFSPRRSASAVSAAPEVVATGVPRPLQLAADGRSLIVLSPGLRGDAAGEVYRVDLDASRPVDLGRAPRVKIPFSDERTATFGSLAIHPVTRELYLGEENGTRVYRLTSDERLLPFATGLQRLAGGSSLAFDPGGRLLIVDYVDPRLSTDDERLPPGLEELREEDYRGPLLFRLAVDPEVPAPRRLTGLAPLFPRAWGGRAGGGLLPRLVAVVPLPGDEIAVITGSGEIHRLGRDGVLMPLAQLPRGQYLRINVVAGPDDTLYVSGGFWVASVFRVSRQGTVSLLAANLADPQGIALDTQGQLHLAESAFHRIIRIRR